MEIFILIAFSVMVVILIILSIDGILTNRKIKIKIDEYKKEIVELENNQNKTIKYVNENLKHIHDRERFLERINSIELREFPDKLKKDFYSEVIYTGDLSYSSDNSYHSISSLLSNKRFMLSNKTLEKIITIYNRYCDKLYTLEKYSQKEQPVKRPVGRPRKEK